MFGVHSTESLKWGCLLLLIVQTVAIVVLKRQSTTGVASDERYVASTAVFFSELFKFVCSLSMHAYTSPSIQSCFQELHKHLILDAKEFLKTGVPAALFTIQNNLLIMALTYLAVGKFQVLYQLKVPATAFVSSVLLGTRFGRNKMLAIAMLMVGSVLVVGHKAAYAVPTQSDNLSRGLMAVIPACFTSAFACVYMEKLLKDTTASLWMRNIQMSSWSLLISMIIMFVGSRDRIREEGILTGYNSTVWAVAYVNGIGGLIIAATMKYAGNILKCFASGLAIVLLYCVSVFYFQEIPLTLEATLGVVVTIMASYIYTSDVQTVPTQREQTPLLTKLEKEKTAV